MKKANKKKKDAIFEHQVIKADLKEREMRRELDSNNTDSIITIVCDDCGIEANRLTYLRDHGQEPKRAKFDLSTYYKGKCDYCRKIKWVTQTRDYFYPDFNLLKKKH